MQTFGLSQRCFLASLLWLATAVMLTAQTFTPLTQFNGTNGFNPLYGSLIQGADGNFYGTTSFGGASFGVGSSIGSGTVFKISPNGKITTLYSFCPQPSCADGSVPYSGLVQSITGNLYGTTFEGGANDDGTVFELSLTGQLTTLHAFCSQPDCADGLGPLATLLQATNGNFYGTTSQSVAGAVGTIFELTPAGLFSTVYSTTAPGPDGELLQASDGNLYGVTQGGAHGDGAIFKFTASGKFSLVFSFNKADGSSPNALIQATDGNFYGTTAYGGTYNSGTVFKLTPAGQIMTLYNFCTSANCADGATPKAMLIQGSDGNLYGTTAFGGTGSDLAPGYGTVFQITPEGKLFTLYSFCAQANCSDGSYPLAGLTQGTDGNFYGTTFGGANCPGRCGTVYKLSLGLAPFVEARPNFGFAGNEIGILGNNLVGATSVTFNGVPAKVFTVISGSAIKATIPASASSGTIEVTTPAGTLSTNIAFQVEP